MFIHDAVQVITVIDYEKIFCKYIVFVYLLMWTGLKVQ